jgi:hypothetical protein
LANRRAARRRATVEIAVDSAGCNRPGIHPNNPLLLVLIGADSIEARLFAILVQVGQYYCTR